MFEGSFSERTDCMCYVADPLLVMTDCKCCDTFSLTKRSDMMERDMFPVWPSASGDVKVAVKLRRRPRAQQFSQ